MKILSRIIETLLAIIIIFTGILVFGEACSCGQCYSQEIQVASCVLLASMVIEIIILIIKARKQHFMIGVLDFVSTMLFVVEIVLVAGLAVGTVFRVTDEGVGEALKFFVSLISPVAIIGGLIYLSISGSERMKREENKSNFTQEEER